MTARTFLADILDLTSFLRTFVKRMGFKTKILSIRHTIPGCQNTLSIKPLAADGVMISWLCLSTFASAFVKQAYLPFASKNIIFSPLSVFISLNIYVFILAKYFLFVKYFIE